MTDLSDFVRNLFADPDAPAEEPTGEELSTAVDSSPSSGANVAPLEGNHADPPSNDMRDFTRSLFGQTD